MAHFTVRQQSFQILRKLASTLGVAVLAIAFAPSELRADATERLTEIVTANRNDTVQADADAGGVAQKADEVAVTGSENREIAPIVHHHKRAPSSYASGISLQKLGIVNPWGSFDDGYSNPPQMSSFWKSGQFQATEILNEDSLSPTFKDSPSEKSLLVYAPPTVGVLRFPTPPYK